jgi:hypothetical protein
MEGKITRRALLAAAAVIAASTSERGSTHQATDSSACPEPAPTPPDTNRNGDVIIRTSEVGTMTSDSENQVLIYGNGAESTTGNIIFPSDEVSTEVVSEFNSNSITGDNIITPTPILTQEK